MLLSLLLATSAFAADLPPISFYGFARTDLSWDQSALQSPQSYSWALSNSTDTPYHSEFDLNPRLSRFGVKIEPTTYNDWTLAGKIELDFQAGGRESRPFPRARILASYLSRGDFHLLSGLEWHLIAPIHPTINNDALMWNAGNLGDRAPQIRASWTPTVGEGQLTFAAAAVTTGAVAPQDLDGDGRRDGLDAGQPGVQLLVKLDHPGWTHSKNLQIGAWAHRSLTRTNNPINAHNTFISWVGGMHLVLPITESIWLQTELFKGQGLADLRGGIGQSVNAEGLSIPSAGGWTELGLRLSKKTILLTGAGLDNPDDAFIDVGGRTQNEVVWTGFRVTPVPPLTLGLEYTYLKTTYLDIADGISNRVAANATMRF